MAQTTSLVFNGGVIPSPSPVPAGSGKAKLLKIGEITIVEQGLQVTKKVICDPDSVTTVAPFMEVLTSARLAELISANSILVLDDGTVQYLMADATIVVEDGTSVCTSVSFLGLSLEHSAKVLYPCTRITDELTLQQVLEVGEPVETGFDVKEKPLSLAWVESGNMTYSQNTGRLYTNAYSLLDLNNWQNPQGDKITYDPNTSRLWLAKGYYTIFSRLEITWEGTPQNKTISIGGNPFDLSFNHKASVGISALHQLSATTALAITVDVSEQPPQGFTVKVKRADIYSVQQVMENVVQGLQSVTTDDTLTGDGTSENPLSVVVDNELEADSENPVQNKVLYGIIGNVETLLEDL